MTTIGITGGIGMGKSTAEQFLLKRGIPVIDTDRLARELVEPGKPALSEIVQAFGKDILKPDGSLDRGGLATRVFADAARREQLENILHPPIRTAWEQQIAAWESQGHLLAAVVIPLLFETNAERDVEVTVCLACTAATQQHRLQARGWSNEQIHQRIEAQMPVESKMARARYVIWTEGTLEVHAEQWKRIVRRLSAG
jgi:dephospho-CoA kinase